MAARDAERGRTTSPEAELQSSAASMPPRCGNAPGVLAVVLLYRHRRRRRVLQSRGLQQRKRRAQDNLRAATAQKLIAQAQGMLAGTTPAGTRGLSSRSWPPAPSTHHASHRRRRRSTPRWSNGPARSRSSPATTARCPVWRSAPTGSAGLGQLTTTRCGCGTPTPANRSASRSPATPARWTGWRSVPTATASPRPAATARCGCGTPTPASRSASRSTATPARCAGGVQPRRAPPGLGRRRRHGAVVGPRHRPTDRRPAHRPHRRGARGGVQSRRAPAGLAPAGRHGAVVGPRHRRTDRRPAHGHTGPVMRCGVQSRRAAAGLGAAGTARCGCGTPARGQPIGAPLAGHTGAVNGVAFSPDGHRLASASWRRHGAVVGRRHRPADRQPLTGHTGAVTGVAFSPDGHRLASASATARCGCGTRRRPVASRSPATPAR